MPDSQQVCRSPARPTGQDEQRRRRRAGLPVVYGGSFDLADEVAAICAPLAERTSRLPHPQVCALRVAELVDEVHGLLHAVIGGSPRATRAHVQRVGAHLDSAGRAAALRHLVDLAPRPPIPDVGADEIASGRWATLLIEWASPYTSALLARSRPPDDPQLRGSESRSERLCARLHEIDIAARQLEIRIEGRRAAPLTGRPHPPGRAEVARARLAELGIEEPTP